MCSLLNTAVGWHTVTLSRARGRGGPSFAVLLGMDERLAQWESWLERPDSALARELAGAVELLGYDEAARVLRVPVEWLRWVVREDA